MKRFIGAFVGVAALAVSITGAAQAAATPVVVTGGTSDITNTSAVLHGKINPEGATADYTFNYGPTPAYGAATVARSAGSGSRSVAVIDRISGLLPGTVYHFQITGVNAVGSAVGADVTFTTKGVAPSTVVTGAPVNVRKETATATGTVTPGNATTTWEIQYGLTANYGYRTFPQALAAGSAPVPVSAVLAGLAPATLFHYRIVAYHGIVASVGADATFFTQPDNPPAAKMATKTAPGSDKKAPFEFTTSGQLKGGTYIPAGQRCSGTVGIRYYNGKHQLAFVVADVGSDCRFSGKVSFKKTGSKGKVPLRVTISYRGNGYLAAENKTDHVMAGK